jgi:hypothetical protein
MRFNIKIQLLILIFSVSLSQAATYYVDPDCTNGISTYEPTGQTCTGGSDTVYNTIANGLAAASSSDDVQLSSQGHGISATLTIPAGVTLTAISQVAPTSNAARIYPTASLGSSDPMVRIYNATPGSAGGQTLSYIELDGVDGAYSARVGVAVVNSDDATITYCHIHDFRGSSSAGVKVYSTQIDTSSTYAWWNMWPADPQADGTDTNIDALWPSNPVDTIILSYNHIIDCGTYSDPGGTKYNAVQLYNLKDSLIHHNTIDTSTYGGECIAGMGSAEAFLDNVDIYNNTFTQFYASDISIWAIETWVHKGGCEVYNNTSNAGFSITVGKNMDVYNNDIIFTSAPANTSYGIEFSYQSEFLVYKNYIENTRGAGILAGTDAGGVKAWLTSNGDIYQNIIYNDSLNGIQIEGEGTVAGNTTSGIDIHNNTIDGYNNRTDWGIRLRERNNGTLENINVRNNIITDMDDGAGDSSDGVVTNLYISNNLFYDNLLDDWAGASDYSTVTTNPNFTETGNRQDIDATGFYALSSPSDAIDGGTNVGLPFSGDAPDIGAIEENAGSETVISGCLPTGTKPAGTTTATLECTTDQAATLKFDTSAGVAYGSMSTTWDTTGGTAHSHGLTGLSAGQQKYYVKASDSTADTVITFYIDPDSTNLLSSDTYINSSDTNTYDPCYDRQYLWDGDTAAGTCYDRTGGGSITDIDIEFDFGALYNLTDVDLYGDSSGSWVCTDWTFKYKVDAGDSWTTNFSAQSCNGNQWYENDVSLQARYVRFEINGSVDGTEVREIVVLGGYVTGGGGGDPDPGSSGSITYDPSATGGVTFVP